MSVKVMAVNAGSSSLKFKLYEMPEEKVICKGIADRIGHEDGIFEIKHDGKEKKIVTPIMDHAVGVQLLLDNLISEGIIKSLDEISAVGHRIVQGGSYFADSAIFDDDTEAKIEELIPLAPLHNAAHLIGFRAFKKVLPNVPSIAVFDTAFHQTMAPVDYLFPINYDYYKNYKIRRYGAHGTSHLYLSQEAKKYYTKESGNKLISCHLGSGASITAILDGKCVVTSMGLTPLGGIMMGTRTGDMDPSVFNYICKCTNKSAEDVYQELNKKSGMLGLSGVSNDTRDILKAEAEGNELCKLTNDMFVRRVCDFIGQYYVRLGGCDVLVFSAGIGENVDYYRTRICNELKEALGVEIDETINTGLRGKEAVISTANSKIKIVVIPTDEEVMIARDAVRLLNLK
ncbi:MAG: acetate kinase [Bacilli bacterium]|nr:acetate kinase [Bacilli bacterium]